MPLACLTNGVDGHVAAIGAYGDVARRTGDAAVNVARDRTQRRRVRENTILATSESHEAVIFSSKHIGGQLCSTPTVRRPAHDVNGKLVHRGSSLSSDEFLLDVAGRVRCS